VFRADEVISDALDRHVRFREAQFSPDQVARLFDQSLRFVLRFVSRANPEALHSSVVIPDDEVILSPDVVDLTRGGTISWQTIDSIDYRAEATGRYLRPVVLGPHEARHRIASEMGHMDGPTGYLTDHQRALVKLEGWSRVFDLRVTGTQLPERLSPRDTGRIYDFFEGVGDATAARMAYQMAANVRLAPHEIALLSNDFDVILDAVTTEAKMRVTQGAQVEDFPYAEGF
jgi:hypothetical protein